VLLEEELSKMPIPLFVTLLPDKTLLLEEASTMPFQLFAVTLLPDKTLSEEP
jgi:hypothetical protein